MSADFLDQPPDHATHRADAGKCSACHRRLGDPKQWRCPYVSCRVWLRGLDTLDRDDAKDHA